MAQSIFISYRTADGVFAGRIYDSLKQRFGVDRIFFDQRSIRAGTKWDQVIDGSLAESGVFLLVITPGWLASFSERAALGELDYHLREIDLALDHALPMIPIVIDEAEPPSDDALPEELRGRLSMIQWERVRNDRTFDDSMKRLCDQIEWLFRQAGGSAEDVTSSIPPPPPPPQRVYVQQVATTYLPAPPNPQQYLATMQQRAIAQRLASRSWRIQHSVWPYALLCGFATWAAFLYIGARAKKAAWVFAGIAHLVAFALAAHYLSTADDGLQATSPAEGSAAVMFFLVWVAGVVHLSSANTPWLRWRATAEVMATT